MARVRTAAAHEPANGILVHSLAYGSGQVGADGALSDLRYEVPDGYEYFSASGGAYRHSTLYDDASGTAREAQWTAWVPGAGGTGTFRATSVDLIAHTHRESVSPHTPEPRVDEPDPNLGSSSAQIAHALAAGNVTATGTATIDGTPAITLTLATPANVAMAQDVSIPAGYVRVSR